MSHQDISWLKTSRERWEKFRMLQESDMHQYNIERLGMTVTFRSLKVGEDTEIGSTENLSERAQMAIDYCVVEPAGADFVNLKKQLNDKEALALYEKIEEKSIPNANDMNDTSFLPELQIQQSINKETHWFNEVLEFSYADLVELLTVLESKAQVLEYLSKQYKIKNPVPRVDEFAEQMKLLMGDRKETQDTS